MIREGQIVLFPFPQTDQTTGKLRPALVIRRCPGPHDDWLICMISSQLRHEIQRTDEVIREDDTDFAQTGLKLASVVRATRLAVVAYDMLEGTIGTLPALRLNQICRNIADGITDAKAAPALSETKEAEQSGDDSGKAADGLTGAPQS